jgi:hypothetical protein
MTSIMFSSMFSSSLKSINASTWATLWGEKKIYINQTAAKYSSR